MTFEFDLKFKILNLKFLLLVSLAFAFWFLNFNEASAAITKPPTNLGLVGYWSFSS